MGTIHLGKGCKQFFSIEMLDIMEHNGAMQIYISLLMKKL